MTDADRYPTKAEFAEAAARLNTVEGVEAWAWGHIDRLVAEVAALRAARDEGVSLWAEQKMRAEDAEAEVERMRQRSLEAVGLIFAGDLRAAVTTLEGKRGE